MLSNVSVVLCTYSRPVLFGYQRYSKYLLLCFAQESYTDLDKH